LILKVPEPKKKKKKPDYICHKKQVMGLLLGACLISPCLVSLILLSIRTIMEATIKRKTVTHVMMLWKYKPLAQDAL
jgi:hypothetical protein